MKILIDNSGYELKNNGDLAMLMITASRFKNKFPNAEIRIFTDAPDRLKSIIPFAIPVSLEGRWQWCMGWNIIGGLHKLLPVRTYPWFQEQENIVKLKFPDFSRWWIERRLGKRGYDIKPLCAYLDEMEQADIVIASGGGYITDSFEGHACRLLQTLALAQVLGRPTAIFGQGLGPVNSKQLLTWAKRVLPRLDCLSLREKSYSEPFALSVGVPSNRLHVTGDDAIAMVRPNAPVLLGSAIGINLRVAGYSGLQHEVLESISEILNSAATKFGTVLRPIPISSHDADSDLHSLSFLLADELVENARMLDSPEKVIAQVADCRIVVTGSYHAGVFALSQGISVIGVAASDYYRHKFEGLTNQFGIGCQIVDWEEPEFYVNLQSAIYKSWNDADNIRPVLLRMAEEQINLSESVYNSFIASLNNKT